MSLTSHAALLLKDKRLSAFSCIKQHSSVRMLHATSSLPVWASDLNKLGKLHANTVVIILRDMLDLQAEEWGGTDAKDDQPALQILHDWGMTTLWQLVKLFEVTPGFAQHQMWHKHIMLARPYMKRINLSWFNILHLIRWVSRQWPRKQQSVSLPPQETDETLYDADLLSVTGLLPPLKLYQISA